MPNPGNLGYPYGNNHSHMQVFGSKYYMLYHTQWLEHQNGYDGGYRNVQVNNMSVRVVKNIPSIQALSSETATIDGVSQLTGIRVNPYEEQQAEMMNNGAGVTIEATDTPGNTIVNLPKGAWTSVYGFNFSLGDGKAKSVILNVAGEGSVEIRKEQDGGTIATIEVAGCDFEEIVNELTDELTGIVNNIYFVCTSGNVKFDSWRFSGEATGIREVKGQRLKVKDQILDGKYIEDGKIIIIRNGKKYNSAGAILH